MAGIIFLNCHEKKAGEFEDSVLVRRAKDILLYMIALMILSQHFTLKEAYLYYALMPRLCLMPPTAIQSSIIYLKPPASPKGANVVSITRRHAAPGADGA